MDKYSNELMEFLRNEIKTAIEKKRMGIRNPSK